MGVIKSDEGAGDRTFPVTSWSLICRLKEGESAERTRQLERLVALYWKPVYCVIRHSWARTHADAKDATQEFFLRAVIDGALVHNFAPERGSFRSFVKGAITRFMANEVRDSLRQKRGGDALHFSFDDQPELHDMVPDAEALTPEQVFDAAWNQVVLTRALERVQELFTAQGKPATFAVWKRYDVEGAGADASYAEIGQPLGLTADQVKYALKEARRLFREIVTDMVRGYVDSADDLALELRRLFGG